VGPALSKHGFAWSYDIDQQVDWISVTCTLKHRRGHRESVTLGGPPDDSGQKNRLQSIGSTITYLQRYTLKAITGVAEKGQDDDGRGGAGGAQDDSAGHGTDGERSKAVSTPEFERLKAAGDAAARRGLQALTAWWQGLDHQQRDLMMTEFGAMKKAATRPEGQQS